MADQEMLALMERFTRLETSHQITNKHTHKELAKLVGVTETMADSMSKLVAQQVEVSRLSKQMQYVNKTLNSYETRLVMLERNAEQLTDVSRRLTSSAAVTSIVKWVGVVAGSAIIVGIIGVLFKSA